MEMKTGALKYVTNRSKWIALSLYLRSDKRAADRLKINEMLREILKKDVKLLNCLFRTGGGGNISFSVHTCINKNN